MARRGKTHYGTYAPVTKPGLHGTLYRYVVRYTPDPSLAPTFEWFCWAYDAEHAVEKWRESNEDDAYEALAAPERVYRHRLAK